MIVKDAIYTGSYVKVEDCPNRETPEFAFIGRSNVGKSSLINLLCGSKGLVRVSNTPGKTQSLNYFLINRQFSFVDLPGYGFAKVPRKERGHWQKMIKDYLTGRRQLMNVFLLVDARHEPQKLDLEFIDRLGKWEVPFAIVFTKVDKLSKNESFRNLKLLENEMKKKWDVIPPFFSTSAEKHIGQEELLGYIENILEQPKIVAKPARSEKKNFDKDSLFDE